MQRNWKFVKWPHLSHVLWDFTRFHFCTVLAFSSAIAVDMITIIGYKYCIVSVAIKGCLICKLDYNYNSLWFIKVDVYTVNIGLVTKVQIWCKSSMFWTGAKVSKCKADTTGDMKLFWIILEPCWKRKVQGRRKRKKAVQIGRHFGAILMCRGVGPMMIVLFRTNYLSLRPNLISLYWIKGTI